MDISNGIYKVTVKNNGSFRAYTDTEHPYWPNEDIFYDGTGETTYNTIRSFTSHTDYVLSEIPSATDPGYNIIFTGPASNTALSGSSIQTTITLTKPEYPDDLTIVQTIALHGTTFLNSTIEITVAVINTGSEPVLVGIRYFLDFDLGGYFGLSFQQKGPDGDVLNNERTFSPVPYQYYQTKNTTGSPAMYILGTTLGPSSLTPIPTPPDQLEFADWDHAEDTAFTYNTTAHHCSDGCVLYYWGNRGGIEVPPSGSISVTALLFENEPLRLASRGVPFLP